jgi:single-strand DNA-binding protein
MSSYNRVVLMGNLTRDPELRQTPSGRPVVDIGLATNETYKNQSGETVEKTCFVDIVAWGRQAETCSQYLSKGRPVLVEGRLQLDQWESKNGEKRSRLRVLAERVQFLSGGRKASSSVKEPASAGEGDDEEMPF